PREVVIPPGRRNSLRPYSACKTWNSGELQEFLFYLPPYLPLGLMVAHRLPVTGRLFQERYDTLPEARKVRLLHLERWHNLEGNTLTFIEIFGAKGQCQQRGILLDKLKQSRRTNIIQLLASTK